MRKILIKIKRWEFWPVFIVYIPVFFIWLWSSFKLRSFFFFTTVNPKIEMGGFAGESKLAILNQIPQSYIPKTIFISYKLPESTFLNTFKDSNIKFPCIAKPDVGERGLSVNFCKNKNELLKYFNKAKFDFIIQEFIDYSLELAVLYYRLPGENKGKISSLCQKEFLSVVGNGKDTIKNLIVKKENSFLQIDRLKKEENLELNTILNINEKLTLDYIGNHNRGAIFLDKNHLIDSKLEIAFDELCQQIPELYFGRFDLKCNSFEELKQLKNFSILEINGVSAEPAHIYQPDFSFLKAEKTLIKQWIVIYRIARKQIERGVKPMSFKSAINHLKQYKSQISLHQN